MAEEIEMDIVDSDTKVDNNDDKVIETSTSRVFNDEDFSRLIQEKHADEGYDTVVEKLSDKQPTHFTAENGNIYFVDFR